jgi:hypothetical protein
MLEPMLFINHNELTHIYAINLLALSVLSFQNLVNFDLAQSIFLFSANCIKVIAFNLLLSSSTNVSSGVETRASLP